jgi:hypothetical protein
MATITQLKAHVGRVRKANMVAKYPVKDVLRVRSYVSDDMTPTNIIDLVAAAYAATDELSSALEAYYTTIRP